MSRRISAIVVAFGKEASLERCLRSLDAALATLDRETDVIVVINRLSDEGLRMLGDDRITVVTDHNLGFAGGVAAGLARALGEWVAVVNDDCVVDVSAIAELLAAGEVDEWIGSVAAQIRFAGTADTINSAGIEIDALGIAYERLLGTPASASATEIEDVFGACAGAALYRRAMLDDVGGFDESFFAYLEDADLAWRARMCGWRTVYAPRAVVLHDHSTSLGHRSRQKYFLVGRNRVRMLAKNATRSQILQRGAAMAIYDLVYVLYVAARHRTLAPLSGRLRGLSEWRTYRRAGAPHRRAAALARPAGLRAALRRDRAYG